MGEVAARDAQIAAHDAVVAERDRVLHFKQTHIDQLMQELALYKALALRQAQRAIEPGAGKPSGRDNGRRHGGYRREVNALREAISTKPAPSQAPRRMRLPASCRAPTSTMNRRPRRAAAAAA
ncbi:putative transposase IS66 [Bordetella holmesii 35009]|nr:putative transposase IS66 [Bordetella holmesii 35009]